jgi:hypothetical protein
MPLRMMLKCSSKHVGHPSLFDRVCSDRTPLLLCAAYGPRPQGMDVCRLLIDFKADLAVK